MTFRVGQKVVCVDIWPRARWRDVWDRFWHPYKWPVKGQTYTVSNTYTYEGDAFIEIAELPSPETSIWLAGFFSCGFRPIVERKTDISIFKEMLAPQGVEA